MSMTDATAPGPAGLPAGRPTGRGLRAALLVAASLTVMSGATISPGLPGMRAHFEGTPGADILVRLVLTMPALFIALCAPFAGFLIERAGRLRVLVAGALLYAAAGTAGLWVETLPALLASRALLGLSVAAVMTTATTLVGDYFAGPERARFLGVQSAFMGLGGLVFVTGGGLAAEIGWRAPFAIYLAALAVPLLARAYLFEPAAPAPRVAGAAPDAMPRQVRGVLVAGFVTMLAFYLVPVQLPFLLARDSGAARSVDGGGGAGGRDADLVADLPELCARGGGAAVRRGGRGVLGAHGGGVRGALGGGGPHCGHGGDGAPGRRAGPRVPGADDDDARAGAREPARADGGDAHRHGVPGAVRLAPDLAAAGGDRAPERLRPVRGDPGGAGGGASDAGGPRVRLWDRGKVVTRLRVRPPAGDAGRTGLAIVAIMRNEGAHVGEWAAFHRAAGAARLYLYDDGSADGTAEAARAAMPETTVIPWAQRFEDATGGWLGGGRVHNQVAAYAHALANFGGAHRWMAFLDADEFLMPTGARTLDAALEGLEAPNVSLPWHMFGRGGRAEAPPEGTVAGYLARARDPMDPARGASGFKMLVDPRAVRVAGVHEMRTHGERTWNDAGEEATFGARRSGAFLSTARVRLNHYYTRSDAELRAKIARGSNLAAADYGRRVMRTVAAIERDEVEDRAAADWAARHVPPR